MKQADKTHCPRNHPYDEENTYLGVNPNGKQKRGCKQCQRELDKRVRQAAKARRMSKKAALLLLCCSCSAWEAVKDPLSITAAAATGAVIAGPLGAAVGAGGMAATLDIANAVEGEAVAVAKVDAITHAALTGELQPLRDTLAKEAAERTGLSAALDSLKFWPTWGAIGWLAFYALRHTKDLIRYFNFIKRAFTNATSTSQKP